MSIVTTPPLESLGIDQVLARIRIDPETGRGSVLDVIELVSDGEFVYQKHTYRCHLKIK